MADTSLLTWTWSRGGTATVANANGLFICLHSSAAYPPGAPLKATTDCGLVYEMKVRGCRKIANAPDLYEITGKLFNAPREARERLTLAAAGSPNSE